MNNQKTVFTLCVLLLMCFVCIFWLTVQRFSDKLIQVLTLWSEWFQNLKNIHFKIYLSLLKQKARYDLISIPAFDSKSKVGISCTELQHLVKTTIFLSFCGGPFLVLQLLLEYDLKHHLFQSNSNTSLDSNISVITTLRLASASRNLRDHTNNSNSFPKFYWWGI